jgi:hypothetical protein
MLRRPAAVLLGLIVLAAGGGGSGCAATGGAADRAAKRDLPVSQRLRPVISSGESLRVIDDYVARYNKAVAAADGRAWRDLLDDPMATMADARLRIDDGRPPERLAITLVNPVLFVPKLDAFPKWFMVAAMERAGQRGKPRQVLMIFTRSGPEAAWRLSNKTIPSAKLPKIATDGQGYAIAVAADQPPGRVTVPVGDLAGAHAAYLTNGATGATGANATFADGPHTSDWRTERTAWARRLRAGGWHDTVTFGQTRYQPAALRTKDGGILAWYAVSRLESLFPDRASRQNRTGRADGAAPDRDAIPAEVRGYLGKPPGGARTEVRAAWLLLPLTYVPTSGRPAVLGQTTGLTSAAAIEH